MTRTNTSAACGLRPVERAYWSTAVHGMGPICGFLRSPMPWIVRHVFNAQNARRNHAPGASTSGTG